MTCPKCQSNDIRRSPRDGFFDNLRASMGRWPFHCVACGHRFHAGRRYPPAQSKRTPESQRTQAAPGPEMAFRKDQVRPTAQVVIQADDHVQLDRILLALHSAVSSYQQTAPHQTTKAGP